MDLKVYYLSEGIQPEIDEALEKCLAPFGFILCDTGYSLIDSERDLAFERVGQKKEI
jgi:hypothetical protein